MIEMILVLIIMAIVGTFVASRASTGSNDLSVETEILKSHLRYAQTRALNDTVPWGIYVSGTGSYVLYKNNAQASAQLPGETGQTHSLPSTVTISAGVGYTINFDDLGSPGTATRTITLAQGADTNVITITKNTGYIP